MWSRISIIDAKRALSSFTSYNKKLPISLQRCQRIQKVQRRIGTSRQTQQFFSTNNDSFDASVTIGDITVSNPPQSERPDLIPPFPTSSIPPSSQASHAAHASHAANAVNAAKAINSLQTIQSIPQTHLSTLRWFLQKDLILHQDFLLLGPPELARERRYLLMMYASLIGREVEYVSLSRDVSEGDLKQRREVTSVSGASNASSTASSSSTLSTSANELIAVSEGENIRAGKAAGRGATTTYVNQPPVEAAIHGRLLILDGLEKAERNVLPTLNNLLENREMPLEDGRMLRLLGMLNSHDVGAGAMGAMGAMNEPLEMSHMSQIVPVHPNFRVAALASLNEGESAPLDPPLRSRFQARLASKVGVADALNYLIATRSLSADSENLDSIESLDEIKEMVQLAGQVSGGVPLPQIQNAVNYFDLFSDSVGLHGALNAHGIQTKRRSEGDATDGVINAIGADDIASPFHFTVSSSDTPDASKTEAALAEFIPTPTTNNIRDLLFAAIESGNRAISIVGPKGCYKSAVVRYAATSYGENKAKLTLFTLHPDMTSRDLLMVRSTNPSGETIWRDTPLTRAARNGSWIILDGIDKLPSDTLTSLALLLEQGWCSLPDGERLSVKEGFCCVGLAHPPSDGSDGGGQGNKSWVTPEVKGMFHWIQVHPLPGHEIRQVLKKMYPKLDKKVLKKLISLQEELEKIVVDDPSEKELFQLSLRKMKHICRRVEQRPFELGILVKNTLMMDFLPEWERGIVEKCLGRCGIEVTGDGNLDAGYWEGVRGLDEDLLATCRRSPSNPLLVPNIRFEENPGQAKVMQDILEAHSVGEKALLISGYQGVGKNKIVDFLLSKLQIEREYIQLHRDSTVQSLLVSPSIEEGRIVYKDSALVRAAKYGRVLVLDEADKAPVEVVALLKGLIEDGELSLPDGRILRDHNGDNQDALQHPHGEEVEEDESIISIHPDFRIWTLTNPAGFPFHGNDLAKDMSDVFSCHTVPPMDVESHRRILSSYVTNEEHVPRQTIDQIVNIWEDLRVAHSKGSISYPFSVRESVNVVKHLNAFPNDGVESAFDNVLAFDRLDRGLSKHLEGVFRGHGVDIQLGEVGLETTSGVGEGGDRAVGGISTPKTRASMPKHGKEDPDNTPHVGGNTWSGGTGGSDTAGLGGRGGPYRLDAGHPVHQISDELKAEVSEEAERRAREMAKEALEKKLKELDMGKLDWERYNNVRAQVEEPISQLKSLLKDLKKRSEERVWLKHQMSGEIDENKLVDAITGEKNVFKRRASPDSNKNSLHSEPVTIKLVVDISASMYRFNSYDGRLQRLLEATLMLMECLKNDKRFKLYITGHSGSSRDIPLVNPNTNLDEATQLKVLECMVANTQYTYAGDNTVEALQNVISNSSKGDLVIVISDANLNRYRISVDDLAPLQSPNVHAHLILIGSLGNEAMELASSVPNERAQVCFESSDLPLIIKKIVANALK